MIQPGSKHLKESMTCHAPNIIPVELDVIV